MQIDPFSKHDRVLFKQAGVQRLFYVQLLDVWKTSANWHNSMYKGLESLEEMLKQQYKTTRRHLFWLCKFYCITSFAIFDFGWVDGLQMSNSLQIWHYQHKYSADLMQNVWYKSLSVQPYSSSHRKRPKHKRYQTFSMTTDCFTCFCIFSLLELFPLIYCVEKIC